MSKLYEALQKGGDETAELLPLVLEEDQPQARVQRDHSAEEDAQAAAAVRDVLGGSEVKVPGAPPVKTLPNYHCNGNTRRLSVRLSGKAPLLPFDNTNFIAAEQYRVIRTRLIQHAKQPRMILISSGGPGDGKSVTAVNVAGALSLKTDARILLVDADFRRSSIHTQLGIPASPGLSDVLNGWVTLEDALIRIEQFPNLYVLTAGEPCSNPSELLDSMRWRTTCEELRREFRYIVADSPPVASVADFELLQASCDGVVLVVRPDHTKRQACLRVFETIPRDKLIGVVMNCVEDWFLARRESYTPPYYYYGKTSDERK